MANSYAKPTIRVGALLSASSAYIGLVNVNGSHALVFPIVRSVVTVICKLLPLVLSSALYLMLMACLMI